MAMLVSLEYLFNYEQNICIKFKYKSRFNQYVNLLSNMCKICLGEKLLDK